MITSLNPPNLGLPPEPQKPPPPPPPIIIPATITPLEFQPYPFDLSANYPNTFYKGQCTAFVASKKHIPWSGNANQWDDKARALDIPVSDTPIVGSIAQSDRGSYGHVGIVTAVRLGEILLIEQNYDYQGSVRTRWADTSEFQYIWI